MKFKTWKEAIEQTLKYHEKAIATGVTYRDVVCAEGAACALCEAGIELSDGTCKDCPWVATQGCPDTPFTCMASELDYNDSEESILRLKAWLRGEKFVKPH